MSGTVLNLEYPVSVTGADGTAVWNGCGFVKDQTVLINGDTAAVTPGDAIGWDMAGTYMTPWDRAVASPIKQVLKGVRSNTTGNLDCFAGVAISPGAVGAMFKVCGSGSVVHVKNNQDGTQQNNLIGSTSAGICTDGPGLATGPNGTLGKIIKIRSSTAVSSATLSGSATQVLAAINIS